MQNPYGWPCTVLMQRNTCLGGGKRGGGGGGQHHGILKSCTSMY